MTLRPLHLALLAPLALSACADPPAPSSTPAAHPQMLRIDPILETNPHSTLLDFESDTDLVFLASSAPLSRVPTPHTGHFSLAIPPSASTLDIKLPALLSSREFPGQWTLVGGFLRSPSPIHARLTYVVDGRDLLVHDLSLPANEWTPAFLDASRLTESPSLPPGTLHLQLLDSPAGPLLLDDVALVNNRKTLLEPNADHSAISLEQVGLRYLIDLPLAYLTLDTTDASPDGWTLLDACPLTARFSRPTKNETWTLFADGRRYIDSRFDPLRKSPADPAYAAQHAAPAQISTPEEMGHVLRNTPGDDNNDGYNQRTAAYTLQATGPRLDVHLSPRTPALIRPTLQITNFPAGKVLITIDGHLETESARLPNGDLIIILNAAIDHPTVVNIRLQ